MQAMDSRLGEDRQDQKQREEGLPDCTLYTCNEMNYDEPVYMDNCCMVIREFQSFVFLAIVRKGRLRRARVSLT